MQTVFSEALIAQFRKNNNHDAPSCGPRSGGASAGDDPDDVIESDDSGPRLSVTLKESSVAEIYTLKAAQAEQTSGRYPDTTDQSKAPGSPPIATAKKASTLAPPDLLDPAVLGTMPAKVMYEPPQVPRWRAETAGQREEREFFESSGVGVADHR
jgi:hypothetical protein